MRIEITSKAKADLGEIEAYISKDNISAAERMIDRLERRCISLGDNPGIGSKRDYLKAGLRSMAEGNYMIFYRVYPHSVRVLRILYGARDIEQIFQDSNE